MQRPTGYIPQSAGAGTYPDARRLSATATHPHWQGQSGFNPQYESFGSVQGPLSAPPAVPVQVPHGYTVSTGGLPLSTTQMHPPPPQPVSSTQHLSPVQLTPTVSNESHTATHTPTRQSTPTTNRSPQSDPGHSVFSPSSRPSNVIQTSAEELIALFNAEFMRVRERDKVVVQQMYGQLVAEREEKERLACRVRELEEELAKMKGAPTERRAVGQGWRGGTVRKVEDGQINSVFF